MTKAELDTFRERLLSLRSRLNGDVHHLADEALKARGGEASGSLSNEIGRIDLREKVLAGVLIGWRFGMGGTANTPMPRPP